MDEETIGKLLIALQRARELRQREAITAADEATIKTAIGVLVTAILGITDP